ncbi:helix-turn-helix transcriptional regulator [Actinokineospora sp. NBRC 105648]|uniref:helix-turn-helix domain-containing protein n=1 Tax=Actinokineospora sp. NBRC 105648 TaxID=3032206 RepID=UPI0024A23316|nr:helix-turn-helix transcriptional regulator [Actinokineospora sp. NBRC 105648]GLZ38629.1 transcriptional regulator [Actinokineospora sp. NBRC 105648]
MEGRRSTVRSRELGLALRRATEAAGYSGKVLAEKLGFTESKLTRMFRGTRGVFEVDVAAILAVCGIKGPARDNLLKLTGEAGKPGWWQDCDDRLPVEILTLSDYEDSAISITCFETSFIPGLLQTAEYTRDLLRSARAIPEDELSERVLVRQRRKDLLNRKAHPQFNFFIDEYVIRRHGPGRDIMRDQLHELLRLSVRSGIAIRVISDSAGFHAARRPFHLMEFTELHPVVFIENETSALFLERKQTTDAYRTTARSLAGIALNVGESRKLIADQAVTLSGGTREHDGLGLAEEFLQ